MALVKFKRRTSAEIEQLPIEDGSLIYDIETGQQYMDYNNERIPIGSGNAIVELKSITTEPSTFVKGDKYYNSADDLIYTAISSSEWDNGMSANADTFYLNKADNQLYRYYNNSMNVLSSGSGGGETLPVGTEVDFDGNASDIPTGWEQVDNPDSYSTSEIKTNKTWIDGKPIYRKVIHSGNCSLNTTPIKFASGSSNVDIVTELRFMYKYSSIWYKNWNLKELGYDNALNDISVATFDSANFSDSYIIIEYTKTTD